MQIQIRRLQYPFFYHANKENIKDIISIDSDFDIYRTLKKQNLNNLQLFFT